MRTHDGNTFYVYAHENDQTGTALYESDAYPALRASIVQLDPALDASLFSMSLEGVAQWATHNLYDFFADFDPDKPLGNTGLWGLVSTTGVVASDPCGTTPSPSPPPSPPLEVLPPSPIVFVAPSPPSPSSPPSPPPPPSPLGGTPTPPPFPPSPSPPPFPPPLPTCIHAGPKPSTNGCASQGLAVRRSNFPHGLSLSDNEQLKLKNVYGFGYGRPIVLAIHYTSRIRIHASYGCSIHVQFDKADMTSAHFVHGGVVINPMPNCAAGSHIDLISEDFSLLDDGKKRLVFDADCGVIPSCADDSPSPPPPPPPPPLDQPLPPPPPPASPSPPPFPPNSAPRPPPRPPVTPDAAAGLGAVALLGSAAMLGVVAIALAGTCLMCSKGGFLMRKQAVPAPRKVVIGRINASGSGSTTLAGVVINHGQGKGLPEAQKLLG